MKTYRTTIAKTQVQSTSVDVEAESEEEARAKALVSLLSASEHAWSDCGEGKIRVVHVEEGRE